jgi:hypothetical protein
MSAVMKRILFSPVALLLLLAGLAFAAEPGPVAEMVELSLSEKDVGAFYAKRDEDRAKAIAKKVLPDLKPLGVDGTSPFHVRFTKKSLELFFPTEAKGTITVRAVRIVYLVDPDDDCYGYVSTLASLSLRQADLEAAFEEKKPDTTALVRALRDQLASYGVTKTSKLETGSRKKGETTFTFLNGPSSSYPSVEIFLAPIREREKVRSFAFEAYAYPASANPREKRGE